MFHYNKAASLSELILCTDPYVQIITTSSKVKKKNICSSSTFPLERSRKEKKKKEYCMSHEKYLFFISLLRRKSKYLHQNLVLW